MAWIGGGYCSGILRELQYVYPFTTAPMFRSTIMAFAIPTFNLSVNIWRAATGITNPPDVVTIGQLRVTPRAIQGQMDWESYQIPSDYDPIQLFSIFVCLPKLTDVRGPQFDPTFGGVGDFLQVGTREVWYKVMQVEDVAKGFDNEYRIAQLWQYLITYPMQ